MATFKTNSRRAQWAKLQSFDTATASGTYQAFGLPLPQPGALVKIINTSTVSVTISDDGVNDKDIFPTSAPACIYDFGSDAQGCAANERMALAAGTQLSIKATGGSAGTGLVYLVVIFQGE